MRINLRDVACAALLLACAAVSAQQPAGAAPSASEASPPPDPASLKPGAPVQAVALTIDWAYDLADKASEAIRIKALALAKSRLAAREAMGRALPKVDLQASASYLTNPPQGYTIAAGSFGSINPEIPAGSIPMVPVAIPLGTFLLPEEDVNVGAQTHNYISLTVTLSQPIFTWGKIKNAIDAAALQADLAAVELAAQGRDIRREVHKAYFGALLAARSREILDRLLLTAEEVVRERETAFNAGTFTRESVLEAKAGLASIQERRVEAVQGEATARRSLSLLTGLDPDGFTLSTDFRDELPIPDEESLFSLAIGASTDLQSVRVRVGQAEKKLAIERGGAMLLPDVSLGLSLSVTGQEDIPYAQWSWSDEDWDWDLIISLGMKMNLFDGLQSYSRIGQAQADLEAARTGLAQQEKLVRLSVRRAVEAAFKADAALREKQAASALAEERLKNARTSLEAGSASRETAHGAEILAGSAALDLLLLRYQREEALADIARITGDRP
jgi:outer membrane protein TolC